MNALDAGVRGRCEPSLRQVVAISVAIGGAQDLILTRAGVPRLSIRWSRFYRCLIPFLPPNDAPAPLPCRPLRGLVRRRCCSRRLVCPFSPSPSLLAARAFVDHLRPFPSLPEGTTCPTRPRTRMDSTSARWWASTEPGKAFPCCFVGPRA
jgi:hypothetical protein